MKTPLLSIILGWLTAGFVILWILEFRRTDFQGSYWLLMVSLACLFTFQLIRTRQQSSTPSPPSKSSILKKTPKSKKK